MKICMILLGADGSILRTLPLAKALSDRGRNEMTWITRGDIASLLEGVPYIQKVVQIDDVFDLEEEEFDSLYNFDIDEQALEIAKELSAKKKYGFYDSDGFPTAFTPAGEYYLNTVFDDELKKMNKKTYQEMMFEVAEIPYKKERFEIVLSGNDKKYACDFVKMNNFEGKKIIGIHMGSSSRWPSKAWHEQRVKEFITLAKGKGYQVVLFGGPNEIEKHEELCAQLAKEGIEVYRNNPTNTKREFASLVSVCDIIVCSDSFALHVAIGLGKKVVPLFFVTSPEEIETYGLGRKIVSPLLKDFFPARSDEYNEVLVKSIGAEEVMQEIEKMR